MADFFTHSADGAHERSTGISIVAKFEHFSDHRSFCRQDSLSRCLRHEHLTVADSGRISIPVGMHHNFLELQKF